MDERVKVRYIGETDPFCCIKGKVYDKIGESHGFWKVIDESGEFYMYSPKYFEVVDDSRADADDEEESGGGHGNTKIPFGLCQREGIKVGKDWTPKDAWKALEGKGYSAADTYAELKKTGKVPPKGTAKKTKKPPTKIEEKHFPDAMLSKTYRKNTMEMAKYVGSHCDDGEITEFLSMATAPGAKSTGPLTCVRSSSGEGCQVATWTIGASKIPTKTQIKVPLLSRCKNETEKAEAIRSFVHEWTHFIDIRARGKDGYSHYSAEDAALNDAISKHGQDAISDEARKIFEEFNSKYDENVAEIKERMKTEPYLIAAKKVYGEDPGKWPGYIDKGTGKINGYVSYWSAERAYDRDREHKYNLETRKAQKAIVEEGDRKRRCLMNGVSALQGLYCSASSGDLRDNGVVKYGHRKGYLMGEGGTNRAVELLAQYVSLRATNQELVGVFQRNYPEIASELDRVIVDATKKMMGV